jgi:PAS domain S-box-containing protein
MLKIKQTKRLTRRRSETLLTLLEALPDALFVVNDAATIVYANASAQTLTGAPPEALRGNSFWRCAPHLVSTALYQAVRKTRQTRTLTEVQYVSPVTRNWLHVQIFPTVGGLTLQFHEGRAPAQHQEMFPQGERLSIDVPEGLLAGIVVLTPDGVLLDISEIPLADAQIRREEVIGKPLAETPCWAFSPAGREQMRAAIAQASTGETVRFETQVHPKEGMSLDLEATITPHLDAQNHIEYLVFVGIDITARKRAEEGSRLLLDAIPHFIWTGRPDGYADYYNQRWRDYTGMNTEQAQGDGWMPCTHPDDRQHALAVWQNAVQTGMPYEGEHRLRNGTTGAYRWFLIRAAPFKDAQGLILKWFGTCTDIHDKKQAEEKVKESRENWRVLAETVPQLVWTAQVDGRLDYVNQRFCAYTQTTSERLLGDGWSHFLHPEDAERALAERERAFSTGTPYEIEQRLRNGQTGEYRWFLTRGAPVRDETGQIVKWFGTCTDIDEQKQTEEALRQSQERVNVLMNSSIIGISVIEEEQIVDANETFLRMTGYSRENMRIGRMNVIQMTLPDDLARTQQAQQELATQQSLTPYEKAYICKDGSRLPVLVCGALLQHHPLQVINFVLDNSARKELEQRKDDFISMASHELKTPLTAVKLQIQLVRKRLAKHSQHEAATALSRVEGPVKQLERLITELLDVSKIQAGRLEYLQEPVDLDALLQEIAGTLQQTSPSHRILVHGAVRASLMGDPDRLGQVFTNLLSNAIKYSPDAETVEMDLSTSEDAVTVRVRDHGLGIPREQRDKIFDRFYRVTDPSKRAIPGLGMGLYIVAEIVKGHGGTITVESEVGKGSTFTVTLPRRRDA